MKLRDRTWLPVVQQSPEQRAAGATSAISLAALAFVSVVASCPVVSAAQDSVVTGSAVVLRPIEVRDTREWRTIRNVSVSGGARWLAYLFANGDGEGETVFRRLSDGHEMRLDTRTFPGGEIHFSGDDNWALIVAAGASAVPGSAPSSEAREQLEQRFTLLSLITGEEERFSAMQADLCGARTPHIVLHTLTGELRARALPSGEWWSVPRVSGYTADAPCERIFYATDPGAGDVARLAARELGTGTEWPLDTSPHGYSHLTWNGDEGALTAFRLRGGGDSEGRVGALLWFTNFGRSAPRANVLEPHIIVNLPAGGTLSDSVAPRFTEDGSGILVAILLARPEGGGVTGAASRAGSGVSEVEVEVIRPQLAELRGVAQDGAAPTGAAHALALLRVRDRTLLRIESEEFRNAVVAPRDRWALVSKASPPDPALTAVGVDRRDFFVVNLRTGVRAEALMGVAGDATASPDGERFFFHSDGSYYVYEFATGRSRSVSENIPVPLPAVMPGESAPRAWWSSDSRSLVISDGWDLWHVPVSGDRVVNLTVNGRTDSLSYLPAFQEGGGGGTIDSRRPFFVKVWGVNSRREGVARVEVARPGAVMWLWEDARIRMWRVGETGAYLYTRESAREYPELYFANQAMAAGVRLTSAGDQLRELYWSAGARLLSYTTDSGVTLEAALHLPAFYEEGKSYPTVVHLSDRGADGVHSFSHPSADELVNVAWYTSRGYAVLRPEIPVIPDAPGTAALHGVLPAIRRGAQEGVVDSSSVVLVGEWWGGHAALYTAAHWPAARGVIASDPFTNLVSAFAPMEWGGATGNGLLRIFSEGRLTTPFLESHQGWVQNSPVAHVASTDARILLIQTDWRGLTITEQIAEYFARMQEAGKDVVLLRYGQRSNVRGEANSDRSLRVSEYVDMVLKGGPVPLWLRDGGE